MTDSRSIERQAGPLTYRGREIPKSTTDQRLLDRRGPTDWVHTDPWRVLRIQSEFVEGFGMLSEVGRAVCVFGSARIKPGTPYYEVGEEIGSKLVQAGYTVITGGGPGLMEAANKGATDAGEPRSVWESSCRLSSRSTTTSTWGLLSGTSSSARRCS